MSINFLFQFYKIAYMQHVLPNEKRQRLSHDMRVQGTEMRYRSNTTHSQPQR